MRRWRIAAAAAVATLLGTGSVMPAHALSEFEGAGQLVLTFTAAGPGLSFTSITISPNCPTYNVTGSGVVEFSIGTAAYTGSVTVTGTWTACGDATINEGNYDILITGDPALGDFSCGGGPFGTDMVGVLLGTGPTTEGGYAGTCHVGSATTPPFPSTFVGVRAPTSVTPSLTAAGYTETETFTAEPI